MKRRWFLLGGGLLVVAAASIAVFFVIRGWPGSPPPPLPAKIKDDKDDKDRGKKRDEAAAVSLSVASAFLYSGDKPRQTGVAANAIDPQRAAVLRGLVQTRDDQGKLSSLDGVRISVEMHSQFGSTLSQKEGEFDLAVNGGGTLCVAYQKDGYLPLCRTVNVPVQDYVWLPDVVLVSLDKKVSKVTLEGPGSDPKMAGMAQGSPVSDGERSRQATLLFAPGTTAELVLPDLRKPLTSLNLQITEYTIGESGPAAMPAPLPPSSAYTYAVEISVKEAQEAAVAAGLPPSAATVVLNKPIIQYVDNFLNFPVGQPVPVGFFDRGSGVWIAANSGLVIKVLPADKGGAEEEEEADDPVGGDLARVVVDGSGQPATTEVLATLKFDKPELRRLAQQFPDGKELWRVLVTRPGSPYDFNHPAGAPEGATPPGQRTASRDHTADSCHGDGSDIDVHNQVLGESVGIAGVPFRLHYHSDRVPGRTAARSMNIPLSGEKLPPGVQGIVLEVYVAGQRFTKTFDAAANLSHTYTWDGKDAYGRFVQGQMTATVRIGYVYRGVYRSADRFGANGTPMSREIFTRQPVVLWQEYKQTLGGWDARGQGFGGWTLDIQHRYDPVGHILYLGDGRRQTGDAINQIITTVAGTGQPGYSGDDGPAIGARLNTPQGLAVAADGSIYVADSANHRIRRIAPDGAISTKAGKGVKGFSNDRFQAKNAQLNAPAGVGIGPDGSIYIADTYNNRIRRVAPDDVITTVAGTGWEDNSPDDGPASRAQIHAPVAVAASADGSVYLVVSKDGKNNAGYVRQVWPDGHITAVTAAQTKEPVDYPGDGSPAVKARLADPQSVVLDPHGNLYVADSNHACIRRIAPDGTITTVAGTGRPGFSGDGGPALKADLNQPGALALAPDGSLYFVELGANRIRRVSPDGIITTVAGTGDPGSSGDGGPANRAQLNDPRGLAVGPDGSLYVAEAAGHRIRRIFSPLPGVSAGEIALPATDGSQLYVFDGVGRHLRTINALTGAVVYRFDYGKPNFPRDKTLVGAVLATAPLGPLGVLPSLNLQPAFEDDARLTAITDGDGNTTRIERNAKGDPDVIIAPFGQRTELSLNADGFLEQVIHPGGQSIDLDYYRGGLLSTLEDHRGQVHRFAFDDQGRLIRDEDPAGGFQVLTRKEGPAGAEVSVTTGLKPASIYGVDELPGGKQRRRSTCCCGAESTAVRNLDGAWTVQYADGLESELVEQADPRWGPQAPYLTNLTLTTPAMRAADQKTTLTQTRKLEPPDANPLSFKTLTEEFTVNGRKYAKTFDAAQRQTTLLTPAQRKTVLTADARGRIVQAQGPGLAPAAFKYDPHGRLEGITWSDGKQERAFTLTYEAEGRVVILTDQEKHQTRLEYNDAGQLVKQVLPGNRVVLFGYDASGNLISLKPPDRPAHTFTYTATGQLSGYKPPPVGPGDKDTTYTFDQDAQLERILLPGKGPIKLDHDNVGHLKQLTYPEGQVTLDWDAKKEQVRSLTTADGQTLAFTYDGPLLTGSTWGGGIKGSVQQGFDNDFRLNSLSINGALVATFEYDPDGLLGRAGDLALWDRDPASGRLKSTSLNRVSTTYKYNAFGERIEQAALFDGKPILTVQYDRDGLGRIKKLTETGAGRTVAYVYVYDPAGRLTDVTKITEANKDGEKIAHYEYDSNGNRRVYRGSRGDREGRYDDQDRLLQYGAATYKHTANGEWESKTAGGETTSYVYDALGGLRAVTLPGGPKIEYLIDGAGRRIGKKVDGKLVQGWLYDDDLRPLAELDGQNNVVCRFVYATGVNVPDYMEKGGKVYRIVTDHRGSPRLVIDKDTGEIAQRLEYDEFGYVMEDSKPGFQPFGFAGGLYDPQTRLVRFGSRDYDAETGRWTAKDPLDFDGGQTNLFTYVDGDPINRIDPSGEGCLSLIMCEMMQGAKEGALGVFQAFVQQLQHPLDYIREAGPRMALSYLFPPAAAAFLVRDIYRDLRNLAAELNAISDMASDCEKWAGVSRLLAREIGIEAANKVLGAGGKKVKGAVIAGSTWAAKRLAKWMAKRGQGDGGPDSGGGRTEPEGPGQEYTPDPHISNRPTKRHGWEWSDADAQARAEKTGNPQGRFGSKPDADWAIEQARGLKPGEAKVIDPPPGSGNVLILPPNTDNPGLQKVPAPKVFIMVRPSGTIHAIPVEESYEVSPDFSSE